MASATSVVEHLQQNGGLVYFQNGLVLAVYRVEDSGFGARGLRRAEFRGLMCRFRVLET